MYQSPKLVRYGSFRNLTQAGLSGSQDQLLFLSIVNTPCVVGCGGPTDPGGGVNTTDIGGSR